MKGEQGRRLGEADSFICNFRARVTIRDSVTLLIFFMQKLPFLSLRFRTFAGVLYDTFF